MSPDVQLEKININALKGVKRLSLAFDDNANRYVCILHALKCMPVCLFLLTRKLINIFTVLLLAVFAIYKMKLS